MAADSRATRNADSLTNAQGEFNPHRPRDDPLTTHGHQVGQKTSPADHAPEFSAQTLPAGTAPASRTFQPNPINETPGQANNPDMDPSTKADPLDFPGATSADVHTGLGHPGQGQTSTEIRHEGQHKNKHVGAGFEGTGAQGGSGMRDEGNVEAHRLASEHTNTGPKSAQEHNTSLTGAEGKE